MSQSAATATKRLSPQVAKESLAYLRRAIEKMKALQATERSIADLERAMLNRVPEKFKLKSLVVAINSLNLALRAGDETNVVLARGVVNQELETALAQLVRRDEIIMPYHLRRFCEGEGALLDLNSLAALTSFYRSLPPTAASRGKYDFVITRLFSSADADRSERRRHLRISREQITKRLTEMCHAWGETLEQQPMGTVHLPALLQQFEAFLMEMREINSLGDFAAKSFFQRIRAFKANLGATLFVPEVTAAAVEANITIANYFLWLLETESEGTFAAPKKIHLLADAFSDTYSNESDELALLLEELQAHHQHDEGASRFLQMFQLAPGEDEEITLPAASLAEMPWGEWDDLAKSPAALEEVTHAPLVAVEDDEVQAFSGEPESEELPDERQTLAGEPENQVLPDELQAFASQPENQALLTAYRQASDEVRRLELHCFLSPLPDGEHEELHSEQASRRASLQLILRADQVVQIELGKGGKAESELEARADKLLDELGQCSDEMREFINVTHKHNQTANYEVLLHVYNQLMAARLRLQSALVRRNASEIVSYDSQEEETTAQLSAQTAPEIIQEALSTEGIEGDEVQQTIAPNARRKWLVSVGLLLLVAAIGLRFAAPKDNVVVKDDADVVRLAQKEVPSGQMFAEIKLHRDLLLCFATESWLTLSAKEQKERLQELLRFGQERGAVRILLVDPQGTTVGSATKNDLYVN